MYLFFQTFSGNSFIYWNIFFHWIKIFCIFLDTDCTRNYWRRYIVHSDVNRWHQDSFHEQLDIVLMVNIIRWTFGSMLKFILMFPNFHKYSSVFSCLYNIAHDIQSRFQEIKTLKENKLFYLSHFYTKS